jgi:hypothetical protein
MKKNKKVMGRAGQGREVRVGERRFRVYDEADCEYTENTGGKQSTM